VAANGAAAVNLTSVICIGCDTLAADPFESETADRGIFAGTLNVIGDLLTVEEKKTSNDLGVDDVIVLETPQKEPTSREDVQQEREDRQEKRDADETEEKSEEGEAEEAEEAEAEEEEEEEEEDREISACS
jgi:hypothetical protein